MQEFLQASYHKDATPVGATWWQRLKSWSFRLSISLHRIFFLAQQPPPQWARTPSVTTHHSWQNSSGRIISPTQRPLPDKNTTLTRERIRTHNLSRRATADLRLRPRGQRDRRSLHIVMIVWFRNKDLRLSCAAVTAPCTVRSRQETISLRSMNCADRLQHTVNYTNPALTQIILTATVLTACSTHWTTQTPRWHKLFWPPVAIV